MAEAAQGTEGDTDGNYQTEVETSNQNGMNLLTFVFCIKILV